MLKKNTIGFLVLSTMLTLGACQNTSDEANESSQSETSQEDSNSLVVGASNTPHAVILEHIQPTLEEEGIDLEIIAYTDYVVPNEALDSGEVDANYFQTIPFFEEAVEENDYEFTNAGAIHLEPMGAFSQDYDSLSDLPEGATILVSNNGPDHGRVLKQFVDEGLIEIDQSVDITEASFGDITENPHDFDFQFDFDPSLMPGLYEDNEGDLVYINSNFAVEAGIDILEEAIHLEGEDSPYPNIIAIRSEDEGDERLEKLVEILKSDDTKNFIQEEWGGAVVPVENE